MRGVRKSLMKTDAVSDELLMSQFAKGQAENLAVLLRRHATPLLTFITRMVGNRHRGEEVFQEVFVAVWRKRDSYSFPRPFKAWLYAIALNKSRARLRLKRPTLVNLTLDDLQASDRTTPSDIAMCSETAAIVTQALGSLTEQQRAVVLLRIWDDLPYAQIAAIVDCTEATARSHMSQGLAALRMRLGPCLESIRLPDGVRPPIPSAASS